MPLLREDQALIHVDVNGVGLDAKPWTTLSGGELQAQSVNTRPGGMQASKELGGPVMRSDVTVTRQYSNDVLHGKLMALDKACGKATTHVSWTPLDADGNPSGASVTYSGILKQVTHPNLDANASAAQFLTLVVGLDQDAIVSANT